MKNPHSHMLLFEISWVLNVHSDLWPLIVDLSHSFSTHKTWERFKTLLPFEGHLWRISDSLHWQEADEIPFRPSVCMECQHLTCTNYSLSRILFTRVVLPSLRHLSASERLSSLHWLPVHYRIQFKLATLTYKTLATCQPSYLYNLLQLHQPSRALRSSTQQLLQVPSTNFGRRAFSYSFPATWNSIPTSIKNCSSLYSFKRHLKSHLIAQLINN